MPDSLIFMLYIISATILGSWLEGCVRELRELKRTRVLWGSMLDKDLAVFVTKHHELEWFVGWKRQGEIFWQKADAQEFNSLGLDYRELNLVATPGEVYQIVSGKAWIKVCDQCFKSADP